MNSRKSSLTAKLQLQGIQLRTNSKLSKLYITSGILLDEWPSEDAIVTRLCQMHFLHTCTPYIKHLRSLENREYVNLISERLTRRKLYRIAEQQVLKTHPYPRIWPWMRVKHFLDVLYAAIRLNRWIYRRWVSKYCTRYYNPDNEYGFIQIGAKRFKNTAQNYPS